jgi:uncharacterized protein (DUF2141 family)
MIKVLLTTLILSFFSTPLLFSQSDPSKAILEITFKGIRNSKGIIAIGINDSPEGWPKTPDMDPNWKKSDMKSGELTVKVEDLEYGTYAVSVLDDENANLEMDGFLGIPKEGYGFSNNAKVGMSTPKFEECAFSIDQPLIRITIQMVYLKKDK